MFVRLFVFAILFGIVWFIVKLVMNAADGTVKCSRCDGKGYWCVKAADGCQSDRYLSATIKFLPLPLIDS
jgi:hypothetical protein